MIAPKLKLKPIRSKVLQEVRHEAVLSCGMKLIFAPRGGFTKKIAFVVADYGSVDSSWERDGQTVKVPDGIAHFLEHQVFKKEAGDLSDRFAARGAYINAHTSHTQTAYFFECVENFEDNLDNLLELVLTPYFDKGLVDTERQIIIQEINQYLDQAGWVGFQHLMEALYVKHPIRIDIAGTAETVSAVTPDLLHLCHGTFYHPSNLTLVVSGDFEPARLLQLADKLADKWAPETAAPRIKRIRPDEPAQINQHRVKKSMLISRQRLLMGFKDTGHLAGDDLSRRDVLTSIGLDAMLSKESEAYETLYKARLIGGDFGGGYQAEQSFGYAVIGGETPDANKLEAEVLKVLAKTRKNGIDPAVLERKRRKYLGQFLRAFNEPEGTAYAYIGALSQGSELFYVPGMIESVTVKQVNKRLNELLTPDNYAVSVLLPQRG
jgi:predicted Zn-dependent peptidase